VISNQKVTKLREEVTIESKTYLAQMQLFLVVGSMKSHKLEGDDDVEEEDNGQGKPPVAKLSFSNAGKIFGRPEGERSPSCQACSANRLDSSGRQQ